MMASSPSPTFRAVSYSALLCWFAGNLWCFAAHAATLEGALNSTIAGSFTLQKAQAEQRIADKKLLGVDISYRPDVSASASMTRTQDSSMGPAASSTKRSSGGSLEVTQPILDFTYFPKRDGAEAGVRKAVATTTQVEEKALIGSIGAYLNLIAKRAIVTLKTDNESFARELLRYNKIRLAAGDGTITDLAQSEAKYAQAVSGKITAMGEADTATTEYLSAVGENPTQLIRPSVPTNLPTTLDEAIALARVHKPDILIARAEMDQAQANIRAVERSFLPTLKGTASAGRGSSAISAATLSSGTTNSTSVGLSLSMPLDVSGAIQSQLRQAHDAYVVNKLSFGDAESNVILEISKAWDSYQMATRTIKQTEIQVAAAKTAVDSMRLEYEVGSKSLTDLFGIQQDFLAAQISLEGAQASLISNAYKILFYMGKLTIKDLGLNAPPIDAAAQTQAIDGKWWGLGDSLELQEKTDTAVDAPPVLPEGYTVPEIISADQVTEDLISLEALTQSEQAQAAAVETNPDSIAASTGDSAGDSAPDDTLDNMLTMPPPTAPVTAAAAGA